MTLTDMSWKSGYTYSFFALNVPTGSTNYPSLLVYDMTLGVVNHFMYDAACSLVINAIDTLLLPSSNTIVVGGGVATCKSQTMIFKYEMASS